MVQAKQCMLYNPICIQNKTCNNNRCCSKSGVTSRRYGRMSGGLKNSISSPACWLHASIQFMKSSMLYSVVCTVLYTVPQYFKKFVKPLLNLSQHCFFF